MIERDQIGIFGKMNAGKSSVMNLLTQQETSIVDATPGTTADTKAAVMELHGLGPVKLFDTPGIDETGALGDKKRAKAASNLKECDLVVIVIDPSTADFLPEGRLLDAARELDKQVLILFNVFADRDRARIDAVSAAIPALRFHAQHALRAVEAGERPGLIRFILESYESERVEHELLPFCEPDQFYVLNVPMDVETPAGRFLRPQALAMEYLARHWALPVVYRPDLARGRSTDATVRAREERRYRDMLDSLGRRPRCVITDSQAIDLVHPWTPADIPVTTFSVMMINHMSRGRLGLFVDGVRALARLRSGDRVLIAEACNHTRIGEDIGTVQIPNYLRRMHPGVAIEHSFGREFVDNRELSEYALIVHCGGCMISPQKLQARVRDLAAVGVPLTNYGVLLSYAQGPEVLRRVLGPWRLAGALDGA